MNTYEVSRVTKTPVHWDCVPELHLTNMQWLDAPHIQAKAQVCYDETTLYVRLQAVESDILCRFNSQTDEVYKDSCLEFFFCPGADGRYFNLECNPNGALYFGIGYDRYRHLRLISDELRESLQVRPFVTNDGWGVELAVPVKLVQILCPEFSLEAGRQIPANFYKCGDDTKVPHYLSWNKVDVETPDFHRPEFFGRLILK